MYQTEFARKFPHTSSIYSREPCDKELIVHVELMIILHKYVTWLLRKHKLITAAHVRQQLRVDVDHVDARVDRLESKEVFSQISYALECRKIFF